MSAKTSSAKVKYTDEPMEAKVVRDFLPPPEELAFREEGVEVTIARSEKSVEFFKSRAAKHHTQCQRVIRKLSTLTWTLARSRRHPAPPALPASGRKAETLEAFRHSLPSALTTAKTLLLAALAACSLPLAAAEQVACHYTYGGETKVLAAQPVASPYGVKPIQVGSYFLFRVVFQNSPADLASIKVYTYADREGGPVLVHQASYPYPVKAIGGVRHGFTGQQWVYEPVRDGELQYWCGMEGAR